jgi:hypothetical protein
MIRSVLSCAAALVVSAFPMLGSTIVADGSYHEFRFQTATQDVISCNNDTQLCTAPTDTANFEMASTPPWTFTGPGILFIIDVGDKGDEFSAYDNNALLGPTSDVTNSGANTCGFSIGCSIGDTGYSRGTFNIAGAGSHSITIQVTQNAQGTTGGNAFFSLSAAPSGVPEPGTWFLMTAGLAALGIGRLRRRKAALR